MQLHNAAVVPNQDRTIQAIPNSVPIAANCDGSIEAKSLGVSPPLTKATSKI
jgi:hypothetical protein